MGVVALIKLQASLLDAEFDKLTPALSETLKAVNSQITEGFGPIQIAMATIGLPLAYQGLKMLHAHFEFKRDGKKDMRDRERMEFESRLRLQEERERLQLERDRMSILRGSDATAQTPPAQ
jgi:hypothetical protein